MTMEHNATVHINARCDKCQHYGPHDATQLTEADKHPPLPEGFAVVIEMLCHRCEQLWAVFSKHPDFLQRVINNQTSKEQKP